MPLVAEMAWIESMPIVQLPPSVGLRLVENLKMLQSLFSDLYKEVAAGNEAQKSIDSNSKEDYREIRNRVQRLRRK